MIYCGAELIKAFFESETKYLDKMCLNLIDRFGDDKIHLLINQKLI